MKPISILLVDENPLFLEIISHYLLDDFSNRVVIVGESTCYAEGVALAQQLHPDAILIDYGLPGQKGLPAVSRLRRLMPEVVIIVLTLLEKPDYRRSALKSGADQFLRKDEVFFGDPLSFIRDRSNHTIAT